MLAGTSTSSWVVFAATVIVATLVDRLLLGRGDRSELHRATVRRVLWVLVGLFTYLGVALSVILVFIGAKMLISDFYDLSNAVSLAVILITLSTAIAVSLYKASGNPRSPNQSPPG